jgi:hypothetical protein
LAGAEARLGWAIRRDVRRVVVSDNNGIVVVWVAKGRRAGVGVVVIMEGGRPVMVVVVLAGRLARVVGMGIVELGVVVPVGVSDNGRVLVIVLEEGRAGRGWWCRCSNCCLGDSM